MSAITYSPQQQAVLDFTSKNGHGNCLITAVAGSGKTFTLMQAVPGLEGYIAIAAYNTAIANEIESKLQGVQLQDGSRVYVGTVHRFGRKALSKVYPKGKLPARGDKSKIDQMMALVFNPKTKEVGVPQHLQSFARKCYNLARQQGAGVLPEFQFSNQAAWLDMVEHFDLRDDFANADGDLPLDVEQLVRDGINWACRLIKYGITILDKLWDFEDMIYAVLYQNLRIEPNNWVLVDEVQDINPTRRALIKKMLAVGGRAIFVGDPKQAIYGFTGADAKSFENIRKEFDCTDLPLTWSFRCAKTIVRFVQQWVSHIESHPDAPEGEVIQTDEQGMWELNPNTDDAILCRNNAPLCQLFFELLKRGIPSHVEGKDISGKLLKMASRWPSLKSLVALGGKLEEYKERQIQKGLQSGREDKAEEVADVVDAIQAVIAGLPFGSKVEDLKRVIAEMFEDTQDGKKPKNLTLTSIHRSKGREWNRVFWYGRNRWNPSSYARQKWQMEQETNLQYVAGTRAKMTLVDVSVVIPPKKMR
jgi:superfamily I DNA/RNA helicase